MLMTVQEKRIKTKTLETEAIQVGYIAHVTMYYNIKNFSI